MCSDDIIDLYERHAEDYDRDRGRSLQERVWLDEFLDMVRPAGTVLDIGCGMGEPIARYILEAGFRVVGIDSSPSLINRCRARFPDAEWQVADMRELSMSRKFDGMLAWDSFFHLTADDQRAMFPRLTAVASPGAPLMFTSGTARGEAIGEYRGEPLYHASLAALEYMQLLDENGFAVVAYRADDAACGNHAVWLARREGGDGN